MSGLFDFKAEREQHLQAAEAILKVAENNKRKPTADEEVVLKNHMASVEVLNARIQPIERANTILHTFPQGGITLGGSTAPRGFAKPEGQRTFSEEYANSFFEYVSSNGQKVSAALYEGAGSSGGYAVPVVVSDQIVPLAPNEMAVRQLATVIPTASDIKIPTQLTFASAALKTESGASANSFTESDPSLGSVTLSAFMAGLVNTLSWELVQDVPAFQSFAVGDMVIAQQQFEENLYVNGTGTAQAQGLIGNVGTGGTYEPDALGNLVSLTGIMSLLGTLKETYHAGASFLMTRATSVVIRNAQVQANLFNPAWTRVGTQDYLYGYPVFYSSSMPTAARSATPLLFGDFKRGYVIGDRGGSGINVKVLDQPLAAQGQIQLLTYRRTDGRVRRSEAIQPYNVAAS